MSVKAMVLEVRRPRVAHVEGQWEVLVLFPRLKRGVVYREKRWIFAEERPELHSIIRVELLD
jgi:hypothetical protein